MITIRQDRFTGPARTGQFLPLEDFKTIFSAQWKIQSQNMWIDITISGQMLQGGRESVKQVTEGKIGAADII